MDYFIDWSNWSENKKVRFAKISVIDTAQLYWKKVEDYLELREKPLITYWNETKEKLQNEYLSQSYKTKFSNEWNNLRQGNGFVMKYIAKFNEYRIRCDTKEDETMSLSRFCKGLNDNFRK